MPKSKTCTVVLKRAHAINLMGLSGVVCDGATSEYDLHPGANHGVPVDYVERLRRIAPKLVIRTERGTNTITIE